MTLYGRMWGLWFVEIIIIAAPVCHRDTRAAIGFHFGEDEPSNMSTGGMNVRMGHPIPPEILDSFPRNATFSCMFTRCNPCCVHDRVREMFANPDMGHSPTFRLCLGLDSKDQEVQTVCHSASSASCSGRTCDVEKNENGKELSPKVIICRECPYISFITACVGVASAQKTDRGRLAVVTLLSLAIPPWVGAMSTSQRAVIPFGWQVKADIVREWVAGKTVWSPCYHVPYLSLSSNWFIP